MDQNKKEELFSQIDELIGVFDKYNPIGVDKKFDLDAVKKVYREMLDMVLSDADEEEDLLEWMDSHDFWKSPASTRFHGNWESGLCIHSLMVTVQALRFAKAVLENYYNTPMGQSGKFEVTAGDIVVSCIAHDFCKAGSYQIEFRNTKDYTGNWIKKPFYKTREDSRNLGHGNESVLDLLESMPSFIKRRHVLEAISRHMGFSDITDTEKMNYSNFLQNPLVILIQLADETAAGWWDC